jgi:hypothetical protein
MQPLFLKITRWPLPLGIALTVALFSNSSVHAQRGQPPRGGGVRPAIPPGPPPGQESRPVRPVIPRQRGPVMPPPQVRPQGDGNVRAMEPPEQVGTSSTLLTTVGAEGTLLAGMVLVGVLRLALDRMRQGGAPADAG